MINQSASEGHLKIQQINKHEYQKPNREIGGTTLHTKPNKINFQILNINVKSIVKHQPPGDIQLIYILWHDFIHIYMLLSQYILHLQTHPLISPCI